MEFYRDARFAAGDVVVSHTTSEDVVTVGMIVQPARPAGDLPGAHPVVVTPSSDIRPLAEYCGSLGLDEVEVIKPSAIADVASGTAVPSFTAIVRMTCSVHPGVPEICSICDS